MKLRLHIWFGTAAMAMAAVLGDQGWAQDTPAAKGPAAKPLTAAPPAAKEPAAKAPAAKEPAAKEPAAKPVAAGLAAPTPYRRLAPGVVRPVDSKHTAGETVSWHDLIELTTYDPTFEWAKDVPFRQDVWMLEFKFKPMRLMWVDLPGPNGQMQRKLVWYLIYSVTNPGKILHPVEEADQTYKIEKVDRPVNFIPVFTLEVHNRLQDEAAGFTKAYTDKLIPIAVRDICKREDPNRRFYTTTEMAAYPDTEPKKDALGKNETPHKPRGIAVGETVWGVATWTDIDPRNVWFSVYVDGLTNASRFEDDQAKYSAALLGNNKGPFRTLYRKALKLNFWRPVDEFTFNEEQIRWGVLHHGIPPVRDKVPDNPPFEWVWRRAL
jgi:hypothetical protein